MKILNVGMPMVFGYYADKNDINLLESEMFEGYCEEYNDKLYCTIKNTPSIFNFLQDYRSKTEKITLGNQYKYEYEFGVKEYKGDKIFIIHTDDCHFHKCTLESMSLDNDLIILIFKIEG